MKRAVGLILIGLLAGPASAQEVPPVADRLLWCSSAMYWLASDAFDSGEESEGDQYQAWSDDLGARAVLMLESEGFSEDVITATQEDYDTRVVEQIGKPGATYDVTTCPDLATQ